MMIPAHLVECFSVLLLVLVMAHVKSSQSDMIPRDEYRLICSSSSDESGGWKSDEGSFSAGSPSATSTGIAAAFPPPYNSARIFRTPLTYSFPLSSPGGKLLRLYFSSTTSFNGVNPTQYLLSLTANGFTLLHNFSPYVAATYAQNNTNSTAPIHDGQLMREFFVTIPDKPNKFLNLTFSPGTSSSNTTGLISGIQIISVPDGLYVSLNSTKQPVYLTGRPDDYDSNYYTYSQLMAMETMIRLNVGGNDLQPYEDASLSRTWYQDDSYTDGYHGYIVFGSEVKKINYTSSTPVYTAPEQVYLTMKSVGPIDSQFKLDYNLTWIFEVDGGFEYLVRLHFCELLSEVNRAGQIQFNIYINGEMAQQTFDAFEMLGRPGNPIYQDFVALMDGGGGQVANNKNNGSRVLLSILLQPISYTVYVNAFLNGLEIFKLNNSRGSMAAPNPNLPATPITPPSDQNNHPKHHPLVRKIIGGALGAILLFLVASAFYFMCHRKDKEEESSLILSTTKPTTPKWAPIATDESHSSTATSTATISNSSVASSLPSDLCRRFSLNQVRIATSDFDDSVAIGSGGFGKVYKGSIDNGATLVAIKRLNPSSNQGANEFRNEIEMLSRLRHIHLVSLIGYCEDHGEMILVYEYMPRGTLRDHLLYKNNPKNNENSPLSWKQRLMICAGSARGLHYLHSGANHPIIHRDVKSTNILLDEKWTAKVSDFGLSKVGPTTGAGHVSTAVKGSVGYLDPEYYRLRQLTEKSDVYSFGVVLFEVLCGRQAMNPQLPKEQVNLALWARSHYIAGSLETIVDPNLAGQIAPESLRKFGEVAELCVRDHGSERPSMSDIVWALEFALQLQQTADQKITRTPNGDDHGVTTKTDQVLISSEDNLSESSLSIGGSGTVKSFDTRKVASSSDSEVAGLTSSASVFSEIMHPEAR